MKIALALPLLATAATAFIITPPSSTSPRHSTKLNLNAKVEEAIAEAQRICAIDPTSPECRVAWDVVEELEAADAHQGGMVPAAPSMDAQAFIGSLDILMTKIKGKMDQLQATTDKLAELGSNDPYVAYLGVRAQEMKQSLADARVSMSNW